MIISEPSNSAQFQQPMPMTSTVQLQAFYDDISPSIESFVENGGASRSGPYSMFAMSQQTHLMSTTKPLMLIYLSPIQSFSTTSQNSIPITRTLIIQASIVSSKKFFQPTQSSFVASQASCMLKYIRST